MEEPTNTTTKEYKAPNHILNDGTFIYLPEPTSKDRAKFFERSIAEYGLVSAVAEKEEETYKKQEEPSKKKQQEQKIHPLAIASARLQGYGISELSKAINLGGLVVSSDYLDLANIVSSSSAQQAQSEVKSTATDDKKSDAAASKKEVDPLKAEVDKMDEHAFLEEQKLRSTFVLKRKRTQFEHAHKVLSSHSKRLKRSLATQQVLDQRYLQLRKKWRLVAPEHGTKVIGPVRSTEVVAIDVEIYNRDRSKTTTNFSSSALARMVPRYVTIQLKDKKTIAEPFLIADPTIGKIDDLEYFDPKNVPKLTLLLAIEKSSTGYVQYAKALPNVCDEHDVQEEDEKVIVDLQHSLFCASLFDSMKQEVTTVNTTPAAAWISSEMEDAYLPPKNLMTNSTTASQDNGICVIYVHQGEIKVQLNSEYSITFQLIESSSYDKDDEGKSDKDSGSQSSKELKVLCRALLLNAQFIYHDYCMNKTTNEPKQDKSNTLKSKPTSTKSPQIVNQCVHLGAKLLLEKQTRNTLKNLTLWYETTYPTKKEELTIQFLDLTLFDVYSQFVVAIENLFSCDVTMHSSEGIQVVMNVFDDVYRNVTFGSMNEFSLFLKFQIKKLMK